MKAAETAIVEHGTDFTMDYLAAKLNISKRTLYENFSSKQEIIKVITQAQLADLSEQRREILKNHNMGVRECLYEYFNVRPRNYTLLTIRSAEPLFRKYPDLLEELRPQILSEWDSLAQYLTDCKRSGRIADLPVKIVIDILRATTAEFYLKHRQNGTWEQFPKDILAVVDIITQGLLKRENKEEET